MLVNHLFKSKMYFSSLNLLLVFLVLCPIINLGWSLIIKTVQLLIISAGFGNINEIIKGFSLYNDTKLGSVQARTAVRIENITQRPIYSHKINFRSDINISSIIFNKDEWNVKTNLIISLKSFMFRAKTLASKQKKREKNCVVSTYVLNTIGQHKRRLCCQVDTQELAVFVRDWQTKSRSKVDTWTSQTCIYMHFSYSLIIIPLWWIYSRAVANRNLWVI